MDTTPYELFLYPVESEYIVKITIAPQEHVTKKKCNLSTIVILDRSGSMGYEVERFVKRILPLVCQKLDYSTEEIIYLITFDTIAQRYDTTVGLLTNLDITDRGCTNMCPAVEELSKVMNELSTKQQSVRLLTVSDGEIWDVNETKKAADELTIKLGRLFDINSQAVRLFTSTAQPDTTALSSILQLNNVKKVDLLDLSSSLNDEEIASSIANLFCDDNLSNQLKLEYEGNLFKKSPWFKEYTNNITVFPGENVFWLEKVPTNPIKIDKTVINVKIQPELNLSTYEELMTKKMDHYMTQLRILKVVDTPESTTAISSMVEYFQKRENYILNREEDVHLLLNNSGLRSRMEYLKTLISRRNKTYSMRMAQIANDDKVSQLNTAQRADYLRTVENTKLSRGLARRALTQGIDFNETLRTEAKQMAKHIDELKNVDDKNHEDSFYSKANTIDGIRVLCDLVKDDIIEELDANDILLMINLVGIPCSSPIGDFPDPMTWRVTELHYGWYVSLSDLLTAYVQSNGEVFKTPATEKEINNVIPIFEDQRIIRFLRKYAPSLLEYSASIGMRRVIADVPMTCGYTICAALWKMIEDLNKTKTELHLKTFERLLLNYEFYVGGYFKHILTFIKEQNNGTNSYYIGNNGITNMISPFITLYRESDTTKLKFIPDILRALYTYEVWQAIRRLYKNRDNSDSIIAEILTKLFGIDKDKYKTKLAPLFKPEPEFESIKFWDKPHIDKKYYLELVKNFYYVDLITLIPKLFPVVINKQTDKILEVPPLNNALICEQLDINYELDDFKLYNIVQALLFTTKSSRVDSESMKDETTGTTQIIESEKMKIVDLKYEEAGKKMIQEYIHKQYEQLYICELASKKKTEEIQLSTHLVESILKATSRKNVIDLMRNGVKRGVVEFKIKNSSSLGFQDLKRKLLDLEEVIPLRCDIIRLLLLGRDHLDEDNFVWNNGAVTFVYNLNEFGKIFDSEGRSEEWNEILGDYKKRGVHIYREKTNYHGHGNENPSYYAYGYPSLQKYKNDVTSEEFLKYCSSHTNCCGVPQLLELLKKSM